MSFSEPFVWIDKAHHVIDTDIVRDGATYFRFSKDEESKAITLESCDDLLGEWHPIPDFSLADVQGVEGPLCYELSEGRWCLLLDFYATGQGYKAFISSDLASGGFTTAPDFSFPFRFRHGGVLHLTKSEFARVTEHM